MEEHSSKNTPPTGVKGLQIYYYRGYHSLTPPLLRTLARAAGGGLQDSRGDRGGGRTGIQTASPAAGLGVGQQVRWRDLQSECKSGGGTWSPTLSPVARLGVRLQVRWQDLRLDSDSESNRKSCRRTCSLTPRLATGLAAQLQVVPPELPSDSKSQPSSFPRA